jgi:S1-C subfamily serine protease
MTTGETPDPHRTWSDAVASTPSWASPPPPPEPDPASGSTTDPPRPWGVPWSTPVAGTPGSAPPAGPHPPGGSSTGPTGWDGSTGWGGPPPTATDWQPRRRRRVSVVVTSVSVVAAVIAGLVVGRALPRSSSPASRTGSSSFGAGASTGTLPGNSQGVPGTTPAGTSGGPSDVGAIAAKVDPGLVDVDTDLGYQGLAAAGTGIVLSSQGLVLTNNHVINGSTTIHVTDIGNKKVYTATVVGYDESSDIAVLQVNGASGLTDASLGDSTEASVGQQVVAIGNAGGTGGTPSAAGGSITALGQSITASDAGDGTSERLQGLIQTDADVQPGDSGGSLVNTKGVVIGVDTAASEGFSFSGGGTEGFAIPINTAVALARQIVAKRGSSTVHIGATAFLGVSFKPQANATLSDSVFAVIAGTAAERAGLARGDVITRLGTASISTPGDLTKVLVGYHPHDSVVIAWRTPQGATHTAKVTLTAGPNA